MEYETKLGDKIIICGDNEEIVNAMKKKIVEELSPKELSPYELSQVEAKPYKKCSMQFARMISDIHYCVNVLLPSATNPTYRSKLKANLEHNFNLLNSVPVKETFQTGLKKGFISANRYKSLELYLIAARSYLDEKLNQEDFTAAINEIYKIYKK